MLNHDVSILHITAFFLTLPIHPWSGIMHLKINNTFLYLYIAQTRAAASSLELREQMVTDLTEYNWIAPSRFCSFNVKPSCCHRRLSPPHIAAAVFSWTASIYERRFLEGYFSWGTPDCDLWTSRTNQSWPTDFPECTIKTFLTMFFRWKSKNKHLDPRDYQLKR